MSDSQDKDVEGESEKMDLNDALDAEDYGECDDGHSSHEPLELSDWIGIDGIELDEHINLDTDILKQVIPKKQGDFISCS